MNYVLEVPQDSNFGSNFIVFCMISGVLWAITWFIMMIVTEGKNGRDLVPSLSTTYLQKLNLNKESLAQCRRFFDRRSYSVLEEILAIGREMVQGRH